MSSVVLVFSMLSLSRILISNLVVANLLMYLLPDMILLYLAAPFTPKVLLHEIHIYTLTSRTKSISSNQVCVCV